MTLLGQILFWFSLFIIFYSYFLFPFLLKIFAGKKTNNFDTYPQNDDLPNVSILMAVFNEQDIIEKKIASVFNSNYPAQKIEFLIGSDNSNDKTDEIIKTLQTKYNNISLKQYTQRQGKVSIINDLIKSAKNEIIISTDAKALFLPDTIFNLIKYFKDNRIAIVGGVLINEQFSNSGISVQENYYMNREMLIKHREGIIWHKVIGIYGALYAIRKDYFTFVPENYFVDDFYITLKAIEKKGKVIIAPEAKATENLPLKISEEFKRKVRIATGNFQNLSHFAKYLFLPFTSTGFCFISHKAIRWLTPFIFVIAIISNLFLLKIQLYKITILIFTIFFLIPLIDALFAAIKINFNFLRLISHFIAMNIALLVGFFKAIGGVKQSIWQPSKRN